MTLWSSPYLLHVYRQTHICMYRATYVHRHITACRHSLKYVHTCVHTVPWSVQTHYGWPWFDRWRVEENVSITLQSGRVGVWLRDYYIWAHTLNHAHIYICTYVCMCAIRTYVRTYVHTYTLATQLLHKHMSPLTGISPRSMRLRRPFLASSSQIGGGLN